MESFSLSSTLLQELQYGKVEKLKKPEKTGTSVNVELVISGDEFQLDKVSKILKITPSLQWNKGEKVRNRPIIRKDTNWSIEIGDQESFNIEDQTFKLLELIGDKYDELNKIRVEFQVDLLILFTVHIRDNETPVISLVMKY